MSNEKRSDKKPDIKIVEHPTVKRETVKGSENPGEKEEVYGRKKR